MDITDRTEIARAGWPLWAWLVGAALAIGIGSGLGNWVAHNLESPRAEASPAVKPIVETPAPAAATNAAVVEQPAIQPDPEIEIARQPVKPAAKPGVRRATPTPTPAPTPKRNPPAIKRKPCNVYDHMDGC